MSPHDSSRTLDGFDGRQFENVTLTGHPNETATNPSATGPHLAGSTGSASSTDGDRSDWIAPRIPGYQIDGVLGRGGMGVVFRARQADLNRPVAIKMILGGKYTDAVAQARFLIEAEVIAAIQHPNVVQVYEFGRHDGQPFFVLEFVGGGSLSKRLAVAGRLPPRDAALLVAKLADGMMEAHQKGVVHRDLKPANVLLTENGEPKITDFGLAKMGQSDMTASGAVMGTPSYMSPEQAAGKTREVGTPTDVYALGAILYELITGRRPFKGESVMETIQQVLTREPDRPRALDPRIPRDLETICLKCLEKDARKRYATTFELATDLRAFLEGRPIAARPVGFPERMWKWARRNPAWSAGIAAALLLFIGATITGLVIREQVIEQQKAIHANGLVQRLLDANTADVPAIIADMPAYRRWADPRLREVLDRHDALARQKLHASLALLPVDATQIDYLYSRLLDAQPHEVPVIRDALAPYQDTLLERLWAVGDSPDKGRGSQRLRTAAALAKFDPHNEKWSTASRFVVDDLVRENPVYLLYWSEAFRPVKNALLDPLGSIFRDARPERSGDRNLATNLLADYASDNAQVLADLLMDADEKQFAIIYPKCQDHGEKCLPLLTAVIDTKLPADLPTADPKWETLAKRQANAAVALLRMKQPDRSWPLLKHRPDPRVRSYLLHRLSPLGADPGAIVRQLSDEPDLSVRRALLLGLGEFSEQEFPPAARKSLLPKLEAIYRDEADPGMHAAAEWLLRQWQQDMVLKQVNDEWAKNEAQRYQRLEALEKRLKTNGTGSSPAAPQWYVNTQGQTFVVIPGPVTFQMGSPPTEASRLDYEPQHSKRVKRTYALAAKLVTVEQYRQFDKDFQLPPILTRLPDMPVVGIDWHSAARYCNWLSKSEGIPESQWCFSLDEKGLVTELKANYLSLAGYRLPTEAELEYAMRAESITSRFFGESDELLVKYAWYLRNSQERSWPVGKLKPNDFGLFDIQGNAFTWCMETYKPDLRGKGPGPVDDSEDELVVIASKDRVIRGAGFLNQAGLLRSAYRSFYTPTTRSFNFGFRPARTIFP